MKMKWIGVLIIAAYLMSGCGLVEQFQQAKDEYLETRVVELLEDLPAEEPKLVETVVEEPVVETQEVLVEATETVEPEPTETVEATPEPTETEPAPEETETPQVEPTPESTDPAVYLSDADWTDEMDTAEFWPTGSDDYSSADYENGKLKITALSKTNGWRIASAPVLTNAYIEADVKMGACADTDGYGLFFRVPENTGYNQGYLFGITCDGRYSMQKWNGLAGENGTMSWLQYYKVSALINKGKDQTNRIGVMALADRLVMYVNGEKVGEVSDNAFTSGYFGMFINRDKTENLSIFVDSVSYWINPTEK